MSGDCFRTGGSQVQIEMTNASRPSPPVTFTRVGPGVIAGEERQVKSRDSKYA